MREHRKRQIRLLVFGICMTACIGSGIMLFQTERDGHYHKTQFDRMSEIIEGQAADVASNEENDRENRVEHYKKLAEVNQDMVGWIRIDHTKLNYPVMQSVEKPGYYLNHDFDGKESRYGIPYITENCLIEKNPSNIVIYGHHMKDGSMFAGLLDYQKEMFYKGHPVIQFDTLKEYGDYQVIGAFSASAVKEETELYRKMQSRTEKEFMEYIEEVKKRSLYDTKETAKAGDQLITLITCEYSKEEGRFFVIGKKKVAF